MFYFVSTVFESFDRVPEIPNQYLSCLTVCLKSQTSIWVDWPRAWNP